MTPRQIELAKLIDEGFTYDEIAAEWGISPRTAKAYTKEIMLILGVNKKRYIPRVLRQLGVL